MIKTLFLNSLKSFKQSFKRLIHHQGLLLSRYYQRYKLYTEYRYYQNQFKHYNQPYNIMYWLILIYTLLITYVSLHPLSALNFDLTPSFEFLNKPLSLKWVSLFDIISNVIAYIPLGIGLSWLVLKGIKYCYKHYLYLYILSTFKLILTIVLTLIVVLILGLSLSLSIEILQAYSAVRVSSKLDIVLNGIGVLIGGIIELSLSRFTLKLKQYLKSSLLPNSGALWGIMGLWFIAQLVPQGFVFMTAPLINLIYTVLPIKQTQGFVGILSTDALYYLEQLMCGMVLLNLLCLIRLGLHPALNYSQRFIRLNIAYALIIGWQMIIYCVEFEDKGLSLLLNGGVIDALYWVLLSTILLSLFSIKLIRSIVLIGLGSHIILAQILPEHPYYTHNEFWKQSSLIHIKALITVVSGLWPFLAFLVLILQINYIHKPK